MSIGFGERGYTAAHISRSTTSILRLVTATYLIGSISSVPSAGCACAVARRLYYHFSEERRSIGRRRITGRERPARSRFQ
jgi:hypothetical protein